LRTCSSATTACRRPAAQIEFSQVIQQITDATGKELSAAEIRPPSIRNTPRPPRRSLHHHTQHSAAGALERMVARLAIDGVDVELTGAGNGPVDAFVHALREGTGFDIHVQNYHEHGVGSGEDATAVAYVQLRIGSDRTVYGVGFDVNIVTATLRAVVCAANRALQRKWVSLQPVRRAVHA
jgi:2-isopropylmalate synthase